MPSRLSEGLRSVTGVLLPASCPGCGRLGPSPCPSCAARLRPAPVVPLPPGLDRCRALLDYDDVARELVAQVKYRNTRAPVAWLGTAMAALVDPGEVQVVTWAPTTDERRRCRGFDHAELLARRVARTLGLPCRSLLAREPGPPQTGRPAILRARGPSFRPVRRLDGLSVALVDDVVTTGATFTAAAGALRAVGVARVVGLAAAHPL